MCVGGVRRAPARANDDTKRSLRAAGELAFGRLAVDEKLARCRETIGGARSVRALLFSDDEQKIDAIFAGGGEVVGGDEHRGGNAFGVARAASGQSIADEAWREIRWNGIEVGRERDAFSRAGCPDIGASAADFLEVNVPASSDEPLRDEVHRATLG